jgi:hypothetical protein
MVLLEGNRWLDHVIAPVVEHLKKMSVERVVAVACKDGSKRGNHFRVGELESSLSY